MAAKTSGSYFVWQTVAVPNGCVLSQLRGVEKLYELHEGVPRAAKFPSDAVFQMHPDFRHDTLLTDNLVNQQNFLVISGRVHDFLKARRLKKVEFLPVTILDHKRKIASRDYVILHPVDPVECIDLERSKVEWGTIDPDSIDSVKKLELDERKIPSDRSLFRLRPFYDPVVVRQDLADAIDAAGFDGIRWKPVSKFRSR